MGERVCLVSGKACAFSRAGEIHGDSDWVVDEGTLLTRANNLRHGVERHRRDAAEHRRLAEGSDRLAGEFESQLENVLRVASERGIRVEGAGAELEREGE
ncbi:MAG TPA: hypothetical protein VGX48_18725 [Pyrinomonadaceae bacterium]|jgi:hypothetical protein|nr:hypothetical protein [Pyrinomonadaceae bacterium]